jgi:uncharacterized membrane protein SpoIIM required for sporulation
MSNAKLLKNLFSESRKTISQARNCIFVAIVLYCCAIFVGWIYADNFSFLEEQIKKLAAQFAGKDAITFIFKIFLHNLIATYVAMCLLVFFGTVPATIAILNGLILGWLLANPVGMPEVNMFVVLIPHGIFEWPAMLIACGIGIWRGVGYRFSEDPGTWKERWQTANKVFFTITLPLLLIAAIIEGRYHILKEIAEKLG